MQIVMPRFPGYLKSSRAVSVPCCSCKVSTGSANGLVLNKQWAITWTNEGPVHWCIYVSPESCLNIKIIFTGMRIPMLKTRRSQNRLVSYMLWVRDKRRGSEITLFLPRHETAFWWRHNGPVMSQRTDLIKWLIYPLHLIEIYGHIDTCGKVFMTPIYHSLMPAHLWLIYFILVVLESRQMAFTIWNHKITVLWVTIRARATSRAFLIWVRMVGQMQHADYRGVLTLKYAFYQWTRQMNPQHLDCGRSIPGTHGGL